MSMMTLIQIRRREMAESMAERAVQRVNPLPSVVGLETHAPPCANG